MAATTGACSAQTATANSATENSAQAGLEQAPLIIRSANGEHRFTVEVARSPEEQARGLMFRKSLAANRGMIFPYDPPQPVRFWMKNTLIPLDMIFIRADGTIAYIGAMTVPHSLELIGPAEPVAAVLELRGGRSAELGIREGDAVSWPR